MARTDRARELETRGQLGLGFHVEEMTRVPPSDWRPPDLSSLPDRLPGRYIGVDTEGTDHGLSNDQGPGWAWDGGGRVIGYSVSAAGFKTYLPIGHVEGNVDPDGARRWLNHVLGDASQTKVFANAMFDLGWAERDGVKIKGPTVDVQLVEPLLDEHRLSYELGAIAKDRIGRGKNEDGLLAAGKAYGLGDTLKKIKGRLAELPSRYVGPYAEDDADEPREIWDVQRPLVEAEGLAGITAIEHGLIPMYLDMRRRGVRIDVEHVNKMRDRLEGEVRGLVAEVKRLVGIGVELWEPESVAKVLDHLGVPYGRTPANKQPRITNAILEIDKHHPACAHLLAARQKDKLRGTFLEGQLLGQLHGDRVHGQVHPLKSDDGGTVTGRLSMSNPNLQFIPARTEEGREIRKMFLPEPGEEWAQPDVSQQEVRLLVHFAVRAHHYEVSRGRYGLPSALEAQRRYHEEPDLNYHDFVADITALPYKRAKIMNFAIIYGRGIAETANELNLSVEETKALFAQHEQKMPFAKKTSYFCQDRVKDVGYLTTLLKRRQRFPLWEPASWDDRDGRMFPRPLAEKAWPGKHLVRARIHKSLNALVQPSAADQTKKAMLDVWNAGYGKHVLIQVHDELDASVPDRRVGEDIAQIMRDAVKLEVPVHVDIKFGPNWGSCE